MSNKPPSYCEATKLCKVCINVSFLVIKLKEQFLRNLFKKTTVDVMIKIATNHTGRTTDFATIQINREESTSAIPLIPVEKRCVEMNDAYTNTSTSLLPNISGISVSDAQGNKTSCFICSASCCAGPFSGELLEFIQNMLIMILGISFLIFIFKLLADSSKISH